MLEYHTNVRYPTINTVIQLGHTEREKGKRKDVGGGIWGRSEYRTVNRDDGHYSAGSLDSIEEDRDCS